ncbi:EGF-like domain-containing protein 2 [Babylonia areolata]|uniref:EGF-like domain-containing protein 2 n=1 Tax=Babylonia areolata TaxID=304850 RepID=UPI003FCEF63E
MEERGIILAVCILYGVGAQTTSRPTGQLFNCHNKGQEDLCQPGTCSMNGTSCDCGDPATTTKVQDIQCVSNQDANQCPSGRTCSGEGQCLSDRNGQETCYCNQLFIGDHCQTPRVSVTCRAGNMTIDVTPHGKFTGQVYANGFLASPQCRLADDGSGTWTGTYSLVPGQSDTCGVTQVTGPRGQEFEVKVRVQFNTAPDLYVATDHVLTLTCNFHSEVNVTSSVSSVDAADVNLSPGSGGGVGVPVVFDILSNGTVLGHLQEVSVGQPLVLSVTLQKNEAYQELLVLSCTASNRPAEDSENNVVTLPVVTEGCPVQHSVVAGGHSSGRTAADEPWVRIPVFAFMFLEDNEDLKNSLRFSCLVLLCPAGSPDCLPPTCPADRRFQDGLGRRRRREVSEETVTVGRTLTVRLDSTRVEGHSRESGVEGGRHRTTEECFREPQLQVMVAVMGVALLGLLIALILVLIVSRRHRRRSAQKGMGEERWGQPSSASSPSSSFSHPTTTATPTPTFTTNTTSLHIPRPKLQ